MDPAAGPWADVRDDPRADTDEQRDLLRRKVTESLGPGGVLIVHDGELLQTGSWSRAGTAGVFLSYAGSGSASPLTPTTSDVLSWRCGG